MALDEYRSMSNAELATLVEQIAESSPMAEHRAILLLEAARRLRSDADA